MKLDAQISSSNSWEQLNKKLTTYTTSNKTKLAGDIYERVVQLYLQSDPKYQSKLKHVWLLDEVNSKIKEKLRLPNQDMGIDLIAETFEGEYWAIQAKYRSNINETLSLGGSGGLSTFTSLAFHTCRHITHGLVCTTINNPPRNIKLMRKVGFENAETWLSLDDNNKEAWKRLLQKCKGKIIVPKAMKPRPHQQEAIKEAHKYFVTNKKERGKLIMPCGTGKSIAAFWIARKLKANSILIAVPSLALLRQTLNVWTKEFLIHKIKPDWICVCSDESAGSIDADDFVAHTYDLGIECTTDGKAIQKFLKKKTNTIKIVFTTYQSGKVTGRAAKQLRYKFDFGILDEAHRTVGSKEKAMAHLLQQNNIHINKRLMMTATERLYRGSDKDILSMDNVEVYGNIFYQLSFKKAIEAKPPIISDYRVITFAVNDNEVKKLWKSNKFLKIRKEYSDITAQELATVIALRKSIKKMNIKNAISFHSSIIRARNFSSHQQLVTKLYPSLFKPIDTFHVSGAMSASYRAKQMRYFANSNKSLMTNARCLTEGVDLPSIDCVCFTNPKKSKVDIVQASGRALRLSKGKKFGYILIPIIVNQKDNPDTVTKNKAFEEVVSTVGALSTQDERIAEYFRDVSEGKKTNKNNPIQEIVNAKTLTDFNTKKFEKAIKLTIWKKIGNANWRSYEEVKLFLRSQNINSENEWKDYCKTGKKPFDIPSTIWKVYENKGWKGWANFFGRKDYVNIEYFDFKKARNLVRKLNLSSTREWLLFSKSGKRPYGLPSEPDKIYQDKGWEGWSDFLGARTFDRKYRLTYGEARKIVSKLNLNTEKEWKEYHKKYYPRGIPVNVKRVYSNKGWKSWGDFLGTGHLNTREKSKFFKSFKDAKKFAQSLKLKSQREWHAFAVSKRRPSSIPSGPDRVYENKGWKGWADFLGIRGVAYKYQKWRNFKKAKKFICSLKLKGKEDYKKHYKAKIPLDIPSQPELRYKNKGWKGWDDFLGTGKFSRFHFSWRSFNKARKFARSLKFKNSDEWLRYARSNKKPIDIPKDIKTVYKNKGFKGMGDFLGTGNKPTHRKLRSFQEARKFVRKLNLKSWEEWEAYSKSGKKPDDIPAYAYGIYRTDKGWKGMLDFLGAGQGLKRNRRKFSEVKKLVKLLKIKSQREWRAYAVSGKIPDDVPSNVNLVYKNKGWKNWVDFLGTEIKMRSLRDAKKFVASKKINTQSEWQAFCKSGKKPHDIVTTVDKFYKNKGWKGWPDFFGRSKVLRRKKKKYRKIKDAKKFVASKKINTQSEWFSFCKSGKKPKNLPTHPERSYKNKGWKNWKDFLGKK